MAEFSGEYFEKMRKTLEEVNKLQGKSNNTLKENMDLERDFIKLYEEQGRLKERLWDGDRKWYDLLQKGSDVSKNVSELIKDRIKGRRSLNKSIEKANKLEEKLNKGVYDSNEKLKKLQTEKLANSKLENTYTAYQMQVLGNSIPLVGGLINKYGKALGVAYKLYEVFQLIFNTTKAIGSFIIGKLVDFLGSAFKKALELESAAGNIAANIGLSSQNAEYLKRDINEMVLASLRFGGSVKDVANLYETFAETTGRIRMFNERDVENATKLAYATGLGSKGVAEMASSFDLVGASFENTLSLADETIELGTQMSLNTTKLLKQTQSLVEDFKGFNFKGGLQDLTDMAAKAQSLRFDLGNMRSMSDNLFSVEGSVEAAAKLRVLGGSFSAIADPITMMYNAINDPEALSNSVLDSLKGIAQKNDKGFFYIPPAQRKIVELAAEALGQDASELTNAAIKQAQVADKIKEAGASFLSDSEKSVFANLIELTDEGYKINGKTIDSIRGNVKMIKEMTKAQIVNEEAAQKRMNFMERIYKLGDMVVLGFTPLFERISSVLTDTSSGSSPLDRLSKVATNISERISETIKTLFTGDNMFIKLIDKFSNYLTSLAEKFEEHFKGVTSENFMTKVSDIFAKGINEIFMKVIPVLGGMILDGWNKIGEQKWYLPEFDLPKGYTEFKAAAAGEDKNKQNDFIYSQKEGIFSFNKDDLIIGGTGLMANGGGTKTSEGSGVKDLNINVTGTLTINGDGRSAKLNTEDLKQAGIVALSRAVAIELHKYDRGTYKEDKSTRNKPL